jgi:hypothetical protein
MSVCIGTYCCRLEFSLKQTLVSLIRDHNKDFSYESQVNAHDNGSSPSPNRRCNNGDLFARVVNGWKHWCNDYLSLCAKFVMSNVFPGVFANNQTYVQLVSCLKDAGDNVPNNDTNNILSPLSKHCGGTIGETTDPVWKAFQDNSTNWGMKSKMLIGTYLHLQP